MQLKENNTYKYITQLDNFEVFTCLSLTQVTTATSQFEQLSKFGFTNIVDFILTLIYYTEVDRIVLLYYIENKMRVELVVLFLPFLILWLVHLEF